MHNQVRIIGGAWRRSVLHFPPLAGLRPTPDRVRETVFNWLGQDLSGRCCLELFAGSGAFSFEALSRGAQRAVCVERDPAALRALRDNAQRLRATALELHRDDALRFLVNDTGEYDVIFVDPPYNEDWPTRLWTPLAAHLREGGAIYMEAPRFLDPPAGWDAWRRDKAGQVHYHLFRIAQN
jgi:16S rRNA (guanine966-N2)-methyltransferase